MSKLSLVTLHVLYNIYIATIVIARGRTRSKDLYDVEYGSKNEIRKAKGFLVVGWTIISDVDIESETYRCLGSARFTIGAIVRIINLRRYRGRISYLPASSSASPSSVIMPPLYDPVPENWKIIDDTFTILFVCHSSMISWDMYAAPGCGLSDGVAHIILSRKPSRLKLLDLFGKLEKGQHIDDKNVEIIHAYAYRIEPLNTSKNGILTVDGEVVDHYGPLQVAVKPKQARIFG